MYNLAHELYWGFRQLAEGYTRRFFNRALYKQVKEDLQGGLALTAEEKVRFERRTAEIREARLEPGEREARLQCLQAEMDHGRFEIAAERAYGSEHVSGKPEVLHELMQSTTAEEVRAICKGAWKKQVCQVWEAMSGNDGPPARLVGQKSLKRLSWPLDYETRLPRFLSRYAEAFIAAKMDSRYPASTRKTSEKKQLWFLSRAVAGAAFGISVRTAVNVVGSARPEQAFERRYSARPPRKKARQPHGRRK